MVRFVRNRANDPSAASQSEADTLAEAFALLYDDLFEPVYRYCRIRVTNPSDAEDMTAPIFTKAFASYPPDALSAPKTHRSWQSR